MDRVVSMNDKYYELIYDLKTKIILQKSALETSHLYEFLIDKSLRIKRAA